MPIRRTRRVARKPRSTRRVGRKLKQSFSSYGMDRIAGALNRGYTGRPFGTRRKGWIASDREMINKGYNSTGGDYSQFTTAQIKSGRKAPRNLVQLYKEVRNKAETVYYRFGGMNLGPGANGYFWCNKKISGDATTDSLPLYMYDLTSTINLVNGAYVAAQPFYRAKTTVADGSITWDYVSGLGSGGSSAGTTTELFLEKCPSTGTVLNTPHEKSRLLWTDVRLNLYGATGKAIKWVIQVVKLLDDALDPIPTNAPSSVSQPYQWQVKNSAYQALVKPYVYNPLALTGAQRLRSRIKVLKTYTTIIQPTSTTETDANPHTKVLKWFMRWDRDLSYTNRGGILTSESAFLSDSDYAPQQNQTSPYVKPNQKIFLMIRSSDYSVQTMEDTNARHGSFDMTVRHCHVPI